MLEQDLLHMGGYNLPKEPLQHKWPSSSSLSTPPPTEPRPSPPPLHHQEKRVFETTTACAFPFLLVPTPQGKLFPMARAHHSVALRSDNVKAAFMPLASTPRAAELGTVGVKEGGRHVVRSEVTGNAYLVLKTLTQPLEAKGRAQSTLLLAAPVLANTKSGVSDSPPPPLPSAAAVALAACTPMEQCVVIKAVEYSTTLHWKQQQGKKEQQQQQQQQQQQLYQLGEDAPLGELAALHRLALGRRQQQQQQEKERENGEEAGAAGAAAAAHAHVMAPLEVMADDANIYFVFPYATGGDLFDAVAATDAGLPVAEARRLFGHIVAGLGELKQHGLSHGDVSLENVVLCSGGQDEEATATGTCRLIDLEMSRFVPDELNSRAAERRAANGQLLAGGKRGYIAPECVAGTVRDWFAADVWSLGVCLYTMLTRHPLYLDPDERGFELLCLGGAAGVIEYYAEEYGLHLPSDAADLVAAMLQPDPKARTTLEEIQDHPWLCTHPSPPPPAASSSSSSSGGSSRLFLPPFSLATEGEQEELATGPTTSTHQLQTTFSPILLSSATRTTAVATKSAATAGKPLESMVGGAQGPRTHGDSRANKDTRANKNKHQSHPSAGGRACM